mmetsp:Transcript_111158/g.346435  ORF Transcript_111158/g.346435 Transcript_111158/m.346435 type:complete len:214 (-) Transcript_111158:7-648(-)
MARERLLAGPVVPVGAPDLDGVIVGAGEEDVLPGVPRDHLYVLGVRLEHRQALVLEGLVRLVDPHGLVPAAGRQEVPRGAEGRGLDLALVAGDGRHLLEGATTLAALGLLPEGGAGVEGGRDQQVAAGAPGQRPQRAGVAGRGVDLRAENPAVVRISGGARPLCPQANDAVGAAGGELWRVRKRAPGDAPDTVLVAFQSADLAQRRHCRGRAL